MPVIKDILNIYHGRIDYLDLELLVASAINKPREFVMAHPEHKLTRNQESKIVKYAQRRIGHEPIAYILEQKEFYGLAFKVNQDTLIPRPETELLVEKVIKKVQSSKLKVRNYSIIDVGTGSGNIIIALSKSLKNAKDLIAVDISDKALHVAKKNAIRHGVDNRIKFLKGNLLEPILKDAKCKIPNTECIILANLPYLSKKIYSSASIDIKKYEPRSALLSGHDGLQHYRKFFRQIRQLRKKCFMLHASCFIEISPEQKRALQKLISRFFPKTKPAFYKDLSGRWRVCRIDLQ